MKQQNICIKYVLRICYEMLTELQKNFPQASPGERLVPQLLKSKTIITRRSSIDIIRLHINQKSRHTTVTNQRAVKQIQTTTRQPGQKIRQITQTLKSNRKTVNSPIIAYHPKACIYLNNDRFHEEPSYYLHQYHLL